MNRIKENTSAEFKTSLFFRAGCSEPGIEQIEIIVRTLAAFMNSEGGCLYMGWNDSGKASASIDEEYKYMNQFPAFPNNVYNENEDGYKRFIQDWVAKCLGNGNYAVSLLSFEFSYESYMKLCKISVKKSSMPIWFDRRYLWVRCDGSTRRLLGDDITRYILGITDLKMEENSNMEEHIKRAKEQIEKAGNKGKSKRILVVYPNGDYIYDTSSSQHTMIEVIRRAGIQNVIALNLVGRAGKGETPYVPFISKYEYRDNHGSTQKELEGYYILTKYSLGDLRTKTRDISEGLGLGLHIEEY